MSQPQLGIDDLLAELAQEGELQSSGRFTLDLGKARQKLAEFQLSNPDCYILKLVQAAVAGKASQIVVQSGLRDVRVRLDALSFSRLQLENLLYCLLGEESPIPITPALRHLAVAVNASVRTRASRLSIRSWDGYTGVQVTWSTEGHASRPWQPEASEELPHTHFELVRVVGDLAKEVYANVASRDLMGMLRGERAGMDNERALIHDHCNFSPIPIRLNGNPCPGYELGEPATPQLDLNWLWRKIRGEGPLYSPAYHLFEHYLPSSELGRGVGPPLRSFSNYTEGSNWKGTFCSISVQPTALKGPTRVVPVLDGVMLAPTRFHWADLGAIFYVDVGTLGMDLTGMQLVNDQKTQEHLLELARQHCQCGRRFLQSSKAPAYGKVRQRLEKVLEEAEEALP